MFIHRSWFLFCESLVHIFYTFSIVCCFLFVISLYFGYWFYVHCIYCKYFLFEIILYILSLLNSNLDFWKHFFLKYSGFTVLCEQFSFYFSQTYIHFFPPFGLCLFKKPFIFPEVIKTFSYVFFFLKVWKFWFLHLGLESCAFIS